MKTKVAANMPGSDRTATGKKKFELAVQHVGFTTWQPVAGEDSFVSEIIFREPEEVAHGKTYCALAGIFSAAPGLFMLNSRGKVITIRHQVYDAGIGLGLGHFVSGSWHTHNVRPVALADTALAPEQSLEVHDLFEWHTLSNCACHVAHNALKWAVANETDEGKLLKKLFVLVASARTSYMLLVDSMLPWLQTVLRPSKAEPERAAQLGPLWLSLGVDPEQLELLTHFQFHFDTHHEQLHVVEEAVSQDDFITNLTGLLLGLWKMDAFSESRWLSLGTSCRAVVRSLLSGFRSCMAFALKANNITDYQANGFLSNQTPDLLHLLAVASFAAYVPEAFLHVVMQDNRVAMHESDTRSLLQDEMAYLYELPLAVWTVISALTGGLTYHASARSAECHPSSTGVHRPSSVSPWQESFLGRLSAVPHWPTTWRSC